MKSRICQLLLPALFVAGCLPVGHLFAAQEGKGKKKDEPAQQKVRTPQEILKVLQERMKVLRTASIEFRISGILEFADAPCKETVDYLSRLYSTEKNAGVHMAITQTLGKIGSDAAVKVVILKGLPLLENNAFNITAVAQALENRLESKAEQWLLKSGLKASSLRRHEPVWIRVVVAVAAFTNSQRVTFLGRELLTSKSPRVMAAILDALEATADKKIVSLAGKLVNHKDPGVQVAAMSLLYSQGGSREKKLFEKGIRNRAWQVRLLSLRTLARLKHRKIIDYSIRALDDPEPKVQVNAVRILLDRGGREVIMPLILHIDKANGRVKDDIVDALTRLTGKDLGPSTFQWEGWWEQKGKTIKTLTRG
ncbi:MAG: HEAT repeat domain-containing protein, partial [Planctomycetota bacterium]